MTKQDNLLSAATIGLLSGLLVDAFFMNKMILGSAKFLILPGLTFGLLTSIYFRFFSSKKIETGINILWTIVSTIAFMASYFIVYYTIFAMELGNDDPLLSWIGFIGGAIGALILFISLKFMKIINRWDFKIILIGGVVGWIFFYLYSLNMGLGDNILDSLGFTIFYGSFGWGGRYAAPSILYPLWNTFVFLFIAKAIKNNNN